MSYDILYIYIYMHNTTMKGIMINDKKLDIIPVTNDRGWITLATVVWYGYWVGYA